MIYNCRRSSFENVTDWIKEIKDNTDLDVLIYFIGNKCDLEE